MIRNILIVTDHSTHSATNSLYELAVALSAKNGDVNIWVSSKGSPGNADFFNAQPGSTIHALLINPSFSYARSGLSYMDSLEIIDAHLVDAIIVRMPQPLDKEFLISLLQIVPPEKILNNPLGIIETSSKEFLLQVAHLCPSTTLCQTLQQAVDLSREMEIVLKPLYSYGGIGIVRLSTAYFWEGDQRYPVIDLHHYLSDAQFPMLAMKYLSNVSQGDKRTIVVNKKIIGSALRIPPDNSWICNVAHGGHATLAEANAEELKMEGELTPILFKKGVIMYGFDTLVDDNGKRVLSEINTLSIGGLGPMSELSGKPLMDDAAELIWDYLQG